jgi:general L-amino acid transport system substrate-binding protein
MAAVALGMLAAAPSAQAQTLKAVKDRGTLNCGVSEGLPGFSMPDSSGAWSGMDVDFCRAVAAAIFDDRTKVKFFPLSASDRFNALKSGTIDLLSRNSTWTMSRETDLKLAFAGVTYFDGQGFMVRRALNANSVFDLGGKKVCVQVGTTTEQNLSDYFKANNIAFDLVSFARADDAVKAYEAKECDVFTSDVSALYGERVKLAKPEEHVILADIISKEPLGPVVRQGDEQWLNIVKWTNFAMINAEELGITSKNVADAKQSTKPEVKRLIGTEGNFGEQLGLSNTWAAQAIAHVGNYDEVFERNVGSGSKLGIPRAENNLWNRGGILYAPPIR